MLLDRLILCLPVWALAACASAPAPRPGPPTDPVRAGPIAAEGSAEGEDPCELGTSMSGTWPSALRPGALWRGCLRYPESGPPVRHGRWTVVSPQGELLEALEFRDGAISGEAVRYENGRVSARGAYQDGRPTGEWTYYGPDGEVRERRRWDRGRQVPSQGLEACPYARRDEDDRSVCVDEDGELHGAAYQWDESGTLRAMARFHHGDLRGGRRFDEVGELVEVVDYDEAGSLTRVLRRCDAWEEAAQSALRRLYYEAPSFYADLTPERLLEIYGRYVEDPITAVYEVGLATSEEGEVLIELVGRPGSQLEGDRWTANENDERAHPEQACRPLTSMLAEARS